MAFNINNWSSQSVSMNTGAVLVNGVRVGGPAEFSYRSTTDTIAEISADDYFAAEPALYDLYPNDFITAVGIDGTVILQVVVADRRDRNVTTKSTVPIITPPTTEGHFVNFGANGTLEDLGYSPSEAKSETVVMLGESSVTDNNMPAFIDENGTIGDSEIPVARVLQAEFDNPDINANIVVMLFDDINADQLALGPITLFNPDTLSTYRLLSAIAGGGGSGNFSGGGGNKNVILSIGPLPIAAIGESILGVIEGSPLILGGSEFVYIEDSSFLAEINDSNPLTIAYGGGTTNYTTGSIALQVTLLKTSST